MVRVNSPPEMPGNERTIKKREPGELGFRCGSGREKT
jgi:hypothetical protein